MALVGCGPSGEWTVASGAEVDGLEDADAVWLCGAQIPDGTRGRTFVALVAAVAGDWGGGGVVMVVVLRLEVEELWCRAPPAKNPGHRRIAVRARTRQWDKRLLGAPRHWHGAAGERYPPPREVGRHQPLGRPLNQGLAAVKGFSLLPWAPPTTPMADSASPTSQPKENGRQV